MGHSVLWIGKNNADGNANREYIREVKVLILTRKISVMAPAFVLISLLLATTCNAQSYLYAAKAFLAQRKHAMSYVPQPPSDTVLTKVGQWGWGPCFGVAVKGNYAYIGNGALLQVLDIRIPTAPQPVGQILTAGTVFKVMVSGNYAFTISPFQIFDISNPLSPRLVSTFKLPTFYTPTTFTVKGNYAYVGDFNGDIYVIDISDPYLPRVVGSMEASGEITADIVVSGTHLFDVTGDGLKIDDFDISDPASPVLVSQQPSGGTTLALAGNYLYAGTTGGLEVYDIANPSKPQYVGGLDINVLVWGISISGKYAYLSLADNGLTLADVSEPAAIRVVANLADPYGFKNSEGVGEGPTTGIVTPGVGYFATGSGMWIVRTRDYVLLGSLSFYSTGWSINKIVVDSSTHAYVATWFSGLKIVDYSDAQMPKTIGQFLPNEETGDVLILSNYAYLLCTHHLFVLDVSIPSHPKLVGTVTFHDSVTDAEGYVTYGTMVISGKTLFVARVSRKLFAINITNPSDPVITDSTSLTAQPLYISASQGYVYVPEVDSGIESFDVSRDAEMRPEMFLPVHDIRGAQAQGNYMFVAADSFLVYNISNPRNPVLGGATDLPGGGIVTVSIAVTSKYVYASYGTSFLVVDVSNTDNPQIVYDTTGSFTWYVAADSNIVLLGAGEDGFLLLDNTLVSPYSVANGTPHSVGLSQNYPDPFNPTTIIDYRLSNDSFVSLVIYDILGRRVETLIDGVEQAGSHSILFNGNKLPSGVYFYQLEAEGESLARKMVLLR